LIFGPRRATPLSNHHVLAEPTERAENWSDRSGSGFAARDTPPSSKAAVKMPGTLMFGSRFWDPHLTLAFQLFVSFALPFPPPRQDRCSLAPTRSFLNPSFSTRRSDMLQESSLRLDGIRGRNRAPPLVIGRLISPRGSNLMVRAPSKLLQPALHPPHTTVFCPNTSKRKSRRHPPPPLFFTLTDPVSFWFEPYQRARWTPAQGDQYSGITVFNGTVS